MVLGAGVYQAPLIKAVKDCGYLAIVVSPDGKYPGLSLADVWINADTRDKETILIQAKKHKICSILTTGTDVAVPVIGYVNDHLGLPGISYDVAQLCSDKVLMKNFFRQKNINTARYAVVQNFEDLKHEADHIGYPVMVKAVDSSGSRGVVLAETPDELFVAYNSARAVSRSRNIIVEKYLKGYEIGAQAIVVGGNLAEVFLHDDLVTEPPVSVPIGHSMPLIVEQEISKDIRDLIGAVVAELRIENAICNIDLIIVDGVPFLLEIGARMGATCLPEILSIFTGIDIYQVLVQLSLGALPKLPKKYAEKANAALLLRSRRSGIVKDITVPCEVKNHESLVQLCLDVKNGDYVKEFEVGPDRIGHIVVSGESSKDAYDTAERLIDMIEIKTE